MKNDREYRSMELRAVPLTEQGDKAYIVEGYASTFEPYTLLTVDGVDYKERIEPTAFNGADMSDVVFRIDHEGKVYARSSAGTLEVYADEHGLKNRADLSRTAAGRELFEEIEAGNYNRMSFAFRVADDTYDENTHTRIIKQIGKVYDVSPVSFPANPGTELGVATRSYFDGVIEMERTERSERERRERQKQIIRILSEVV